VRPQIPACRTVAGDDVDLPSRSNLHLNGIEDSDELLMAMVLHIATDDDDVV
jgi:hypothetical protein